MFVMGGEKSRKSQLNKTQSCTSQSGAWMDLPPKHSRLHGYMDSRSWSETLTKTFQILWV